MSEQFDVGGVLLERPFKVRRLGHVGLNVDGVEASLAFYEDLLGFHESDRIDFAAMLPPDWLADLPETSGRFLHHGPDHHSFVVFPKCVMDKLGRDPAGVTINQLTWQVGSLQQVADAHRWLADSQVRVYRAGRDMPGSNWHVYFADPDGHVNELYYGMEQIGWDGLSKPAAMHDRGFHQAPELPQIAEFEEVLNANAAGVDLASGTRLTERSGLRVPVEGVLLARPFKVVRLGPVGLFVADIDASLDFYVQRLGFIATESTEVDGITCHYLRAGTEHHSLALIPTALRGQLGLSEHSTTAWIGLQVGSYRQLLDAAEFLRANGTRVVDAPADVLPGVEHAVFAFDPAGHAFLIYFAMEQIGWDGRARPADQRPDTSRPWPTAIATDPAHYTGEPFLGPWG